MLLKHTSVPHAAHKTHSQAGTSPGEGDFSWRILHRPLQPSEPSRVCSPYEETQKEKDKRDLILVDSFRELRWEDKLHAGFCCANMSSPHCYEEKAHTKQQCHTHSGHPSIPSLLSSKLLFINKCRCLLKVTFHPKFATHILPFPNHSQI